MKTNVDSVLKAFARLIRTYVGALLWCSALLFFFACFHLRGALPGRTANQSIALLQQGHTYHQGVSETSLASFPLINDDPSGDDDGDDDEDDEEDEDTGDLSTLTLVIEHPLSGRLEVASHPISRIGVS